MRHITARERQLEALPRRRNAIRETEPKRFRPRPATIFVVFASDLPAYIWPEVYMAMCHSQNLVPSSALHRERRKAINDKKNMSKRR